MEIKTTTLEEVIENFASLKPDLVDNCATYYGAYLNGELVGIVSFVNHPYTIYLCHDYVKEEHRSKGIYKLLCDYREMQIKSLNKPVSAHCNVNSLKNFLNNGYVIEKALFKVVKEIK